MTGDQELRAQRCAKERSALKAAMNKVPTAVVAGGVTRAQAWKQARVEAERVMRREPTDPTIYMAARRSLELCSTANVDTLAEVVYGVK